MKKLILSIAIVLTVFSTTYANRTSNISQRAVASFQKDFKQASEVSWAEKNNYELATFQMDKQIYFAYYDYQGDLIGVVHNILTTNLSDFLQKDIKKHYSDYWVSELFQVTYEDGGVYYYIQLKNADQTILLSTEGSGIWHPYSLPKNKIENL
jgi:hypothetical protein